MRLFKTLFNIVKLPVVVVKDAVCVLPDMSMGKTPFQDTERQCQKIDEAAEEK